MFDADETAVHAPYCDDDDLAPEVHMLTAVSGTSRKVSASEQLGQLSWGEADMTAARLASLDTASLHPHHLNRNRPFRSWFGNGPPLTA